MKLKQDSASALEKELEKYGLAFDLYLPSTGSVTTLITRALLSAIREHRFRIRRGGEYSLEEDANYSDTFWVPLTPGRNHESHHEYRDNCTANDITAKFVEDKMTLFDVGPRTEPKKLIIFGTFHSVLQTHV